MPWFRLAAPMMLAPGISPRTICQGHGVINYRVLWVTGMGPSGPVKDNPTLAAATRLIRAIIRHSIRSLAMMGE